jgi:hypothetical protein
MKMIRRMLPLVIMLAGCHARTRVTETDAPASLGTAAPGQFTDLAPGDTNAVLDMMRQTMQSIDAGLGDMTQRDTTILPVGDSVSHHLTVWLQQGVPRKLVVIDSAGHGQDNAETAVWFMGGDVSVIQQVTDSYAFDSDRIVMWTDDVLQPRADVTADQMMAKQAALIAQVRGWLHVFGIGMP